MSDYQFEPGASFIFGGSGGLGSAISLAFADAGVPVALTYRSNADAAVHVEQQILAAGGSVSVHRVDAEPTAIEDALKEAAAFHEGLHTVVYAAGPTIRPEFFSATERAVWKEWLNGDLGAAINLATASLPHLRATQGAFLALSTYQSDVIEVKAGPSAIAKAAVDRMVAVIAKEEGRYGVRANSLRCGWFDVPANHRLFQKNPRLRDAKIGQIPLGRLGRTEDLTAAVLFLCSKRASFITGTHLMIDGGESL